MYFLITFSETTLKSRKTRKWLEKSLLLDLKRRLNIEDFEKKGSVIYIKGKKSFLDLLTKTPGISTVFVADKVEGHNLLKKVEEKALKIAKRFKGTFAVRCKSVSSVSSTKVNEIIGAAIVEKYGLDVDLSNPDNTLFIRLERNRAFLGTKLLKGLGGLPYGTQGKVLVLFSGGIDSPVASLLMIRKGCQPFFVYFNMSPFVSEEVSKRTYKSLMKLKPFFFDSYLFIVPFGNIIKYIAENAKRNLTCVLCKRSMYKAANIIAKKIGVDGLVTGESLGEVASQTLRNLTVLNSASKFLVLRPLVGMRKDEIVELSKKYGLFSAYSKLKSCAFTPSPVETHAEIEMVKKEEEKLDVDKLIKKSVENAKIMQI